jgi:hypothetical protein
MVKKDNKLTVCTADLKLSALILSEIPNCTFDVKEQGNSLLKTITISFPETYEQDVMLLKEDFLNKRALANVYLYNRSLNMLRDRLKDERMDRHDKRQAR